MEIEGFGGAQGTEGGLRKLCGTGLSPHLSEPVPSDLNKGVPYLSLSCWGMKWDLPWKGPSTGPAPQ